MTTILEVKELSISYDSTPVLKDFNLNLAAGEILAIKGESGVGKTSLLNTLAGFLPINAGLITLDGNIISEKNFTLAPQKRNIGVVFQDPSLFSHMTIEKNIAFGLHKLNKKEQYERVNLLSKLVEINTRLNAYPHKLSGGQQQRVALIRSIAPHPKVLLLDEPFAHLDAQSRQSICKKTKAYLKQHNISTIIVTHYADDADNISDRQISLL